MQPFPWLSTPASHLHMQLGLLRSQRAPAGAVLGQGPKVGQDLANLVVGWVGGGTSRQEAEAKLAKACAFPCPA